MNASNPAPPHQSTIYLRTQKNRLESYILTFFCWLLTLGNWILFFMLININSKDPPITKDNFYELFHSFPKKQKLKIIYLIVFLLLYVIYFILEISSPMFKYICNKQKKKIADKLISIFTKVPKIKLKSKSKIRVNEYTKKIVSKEFTIFSARDVSGLFVLNSDEETIERKKYVLLNLNEELILEDERTFSDYRKLKEDFIKENKLRNRNFQIEEEIKINGLKNYYMIKLNEEDSFFINKAFFIILTLFSFVELYKIYINYISIYQEFTIKKIISSYRDLKNDEKYNIFNPQLNLIIHHHILNSNNYNYLLTDNNNSSNSGNSNTHRNSKRIILDKESLRTRDEEDNGGNNKIIPNPYTKNKNY